MEGKEEPNTRNLTGTEIVNTYKYCPRYGITSNFSYTTNHHQPLPALLPLPSTMSPYFLQNQGFGSKNNYKTAPRNRSNSLPDTSLASKIQDSSVAQVPWPELENKVCLASDNQTGRKTTIGLKPEPLALAKRPDSGGVEGKTITLLTNHFLVKLDPSQKIFQYDVEINPCPSKELARTIKRKLVEENKAALCGGRMAYDGRRTIYGPIEFQNDKLEFYISLPIEKHHQEKIFRVNIKLVSKLDGVVDDDNTPLPQEYFHALDVVQREGPNEKCLSIGRSFYSGLMGGENDIGGGAIALGGFFQSLRPTQQGMSLNVDFSVMAFHESIGMIAYLRKRFSFMHNVISRKDIRFLTGEEKGEVDKALRNLRIFVCHRKTEQRYRVYGLTEEITDDLWFTDRDGKRLRLVKYFKDHYEYDVMYTNLPCEGSLVTYLWSFL